MDATATAVQAATHPAGAVDGLSERDQQIIQALSQGIVNKLLHQPTVRLKAHTGNGTGLEYASALQELFGLEHGGA